MKWNLPIEIKHKKSFQPIKYQDKILLWGSCFSENIGKQLEDSKFQSCNNPNGILYNPKSIYSAFNRIIENRTYTENDLKHFNDAWLSLDHHTSFSNIIKEKTLEDINSSFTIASDYVKNANTIIVTFGTAYYYKQFSTGKVVGNCHKIPAREFTREKLSIGEIVEDYSELIKKVKFINPKAQWIFTVSPIRHWKDGAVNNNLSKSTLVCAVQGIIRDNKNAHYFPSYEIMMDELRDYRFYKEDMVHPSDQAINHIWIKFLETSFSKDAIKLLEEISKIKKACRHKPFNFESSQHQVFTEKTRQKITNLITANSFLNFDSELEKLQLKKR